MNRRLDVDGAELERFRDYLMLLSRLQLGPQMRGRLEASDLVQQTLLDACRDLAAFRGSTEEELAGWLRRMLVCNLADARRALGREKRGGEAPRGSGFVLGFRLTENPKNRERLREGQALFWVFD